MITACSVYVTGQTNPYENLALEQFLTFDAGDEECILYLWQNRQTVVIGRNQNCWKECEVSLLEEEGGYLARRLSGGGAVYHDLGNLNFTFCMKKVNADVDRQLDVLIRAVGKLGIRAEKTGRNDVTTDGRKFSGNAFFDAKGYYCHHGTLLLDVDKEQMSRYLNVSKAKLQSKGVESVKSRVVNLKELAPGLTVELMKQCMTEAFGECYGCEVKQIPESRICRERVREGYEEFASWNWKYGRKIPFTSRMEQRFAWGGLELELEVNAGIIEQAGLYSDAMEYQWFQGAGNCLKGCRYSEWEIVNRLIPVLLANGAPEEMLKDTRQLVCDGM